MNLYSSNSWYESGRYWLNQSVECSKMFSLRHFCKLYRKKFPFRELHSVRSHEFSLNSEFFQSFIPDENAIDEIENESKIRKSRGSIQLLRHHFRNYQNTNDTDKKREFRLKLIDELKKFPNKTHPTVLSYGAESDKVELYAFGDLHKNPIPNSKSYQELGIMSNTIRMSQLGNFCGSRSYYFMNSVAELETALIQYTTDKLLEKGFELLSVPDILPAELIEACGQQVDGHPTQVYRLKPSGLCLSGTSEMALAGYFSGKTFDASELPKKVMAMFATCLPTQSDSLLEEFRMIQRELFEGLGICFKLFDMPVHDLGSPAYRKYDIEAWMPSRNEFGEISSTSNCTDYQSKRLNIYYQDGSNKFHAHTVNGTACAIPRMIIALLEQNQTPRSVKVPSALQPYMGVEELRTSNAVPRTMLVKHFDQQT